MTETSTGSVQKVLFAALALLCVSNQPVKAETSGEQTHRSPTAVALRPDGTELLTANSTSGTVSLVQTAASGSVLQELEVGGFPQDVVWINPTQAVISLGKADKLTFVTFKDQKLQLAGTLPIKGEPTGLAVSVNRQFVYVTQTLIDQVAEIDVQTQKVTRTLSTGGLPRTVAVSPNGEWLITCANVPGVVTVHNLANGELLSSRKIFDDGFNLGIPAITADSRRVILPHIVNRGFSVTPRNIEIGWVLDNRLTRLPLPDGEKADQQQLGLDVHRNAVGDVHQALLGEDGERLVVSAAGTHELLVLRFPDIPWPPGDPGDFVRPELAKDAARYRRISVGGRPMGMTWINQQTVAVANYLRDSLQLVNVDTGKIEQEISLGAPSEISLARRGEALFLDADLSLHSWYSCQTCHPGGHTAGQVFDTRNDGGYGLPKLIPTLQGVAQTGPWTWHGWQTDLHDAMKVSLEESMATRQKITDAEAAALTAYLSTLSPPVSPHTSDTVAEKTLRDQGQALFLGKAGCKDCHQGESLTAEGRFVIGLESKQDRYEGFNPPSLRGLSARRRFLHDGRARNVEDVLTKWHRPEDLSGEKLTAEEQAALLAYLRSI